MEPVKIYTTSDLERVKKTFYQNGFTIPSSREGIVLYPGVQSVDYLSPVDPGLTSNGFGVLLQSVRENSNLNTDETFGYHDDTHELPISLISAYDVSVKRFLSGLDLPEDKFGDNNPLVKAVDNLENVVMFFDGARFSGGEVLGEILAER